jgi:hypothetical protein
LETKLLDGVPPRPDDDLLMALIEAQCSPWGGGGMPMTIGIRGPAEKVYRIIRADGMGEWHDFTKALIDAGLTDEGESPWGRYTFDATFR